MDKDTQLPAEQNKWEAKEWGEESYAITNGKIAIVTADACDDGYLLAIVDLFNGSGYRFHSENKLELDLHIEAEAAKMDLAQWKDHCKELQAKCDRYKTLLENSNMALMLKGYAGKLLNEINEALSAGEGEKPKPWWEGKAIDDMPEYVKITGIGCSVIQGTVVKTEGAGVFDDPKFDNMGEPYVLVRDKYFDTYGLTRMNCRNCIPATEADYLAYLQTTNQLNNG